MPVTPEQFRGALRGWATGVSVVTTDRLGGIQGITVSSFGSLSLDPPLVLICINKKSSSRRLIEEQRAFGVNILREDQQDLSDRAAGFAGPQGNWLLGVRHRRVTTGAPVLLDCLAWLDCALVAAHDGGDHTIFVGRVEAAGQEDAAPLLYFNGGYRRLGGPARAPNTARAPGAARVPRRTRARRTGRTPGANSGRRRA